MRPPRWVQRGDGGCSERVTQGWLQRLLHIGDGHRVVPPVIAGNDDGDRDGDTPYPPTRKRRRQHALDHYPRNNQEHADGVHIENAEHDGRVPSSETYEE